NFRVSLMFSWLFFGGFATVDLGDRCRVISIDRVIFGFELLWLLWLGGLPAAWHTWLLWHLVTSRSVACNVSSVVARALGQPCLARGGRIYQPIPSLLRGLDTSTPRPDRATAAVLSSVAR